MKRIRTIVMVLAVAGAGLFAYANVRELSESEKLKRVAFASFLIKGKITETEKFDLEKSISDLTGVTACSISNDGDVAAVIFYPDIVTPDDLASALRSDGMVNVTRKSLTTAGGCPVHQLGSFTQLIAALDLRN